MLDSLSNVLPPADWDAVATYIISRSLLHGRRRARRCARPRRPSPSAGVEPLMARPAPQRQEWAAQHADALAEPDLFAIIDHDPNVDRETASAAGRRRPA